MQRSKNALLQSPSPSPETSGRLVLASGSPRRRELLAGLGIEPLVRPVDIDESPLPNEQAEPYVLRLAKAKAQAQGDPGEVILAADTVVAVDGDLLGKPADRDEAERMLQRLSGRAHQVLTGVALWCPGGCPGQYPEQDPERPGHPDAGLQAEVVTTQVFFHPMSHQEISWYVETGEPMDKAGAYAVQGLAAVFVDRLEGNYSNVVGLPLPTVYRLLSQIGMIVLQPTG